MMKIYSIDRYWLKVNIKVLTISVKQAHTCVCTCTYVNDVLFWNMWHCEIHPEISWHMCILWPHVDINVKEVSQNESGF